MEAAHSLRMSSLKVLPKVLLIQAAQEVFL